jgi:hypothetical protein
MVVHCLGFCCEKNPARSTRQHRAHLAFFAVQVVVQQLGGLIAVGNSALVSARTSCHMQSKGAILWPLGVDKIVQVAPQSLEMSIFGGAVGAAAGFWGWLVTHFVVVLFFQRMV